MCSGRSIHAAGLATCKGSALTPALYLCPYYTHIYIYSYLGGGGGRERIQWFSGFICGSEFRDHSGSVQMTISGTQDDHMQSKLLNSLIFVYLNLNWSPPSIFCILGNGLKQLQCLRQNSLFKGSIF